jgi:hypothetical protein
VLFGTFWYICVSFSKFWCILVIFFYDNSCHSAGGQHRAAAHHVVPDVDACLTRYGTEEEINKNRQKIFFNIYFTAVASMGVCTCTHD